MDKYYEEKHKIEEQMRGLKIRLREIQELQDQEAAKKKLDSMTDSEKNRLRQALFPGGIASEEGVGKPE